MDNKFEFPPRKTNRWHKHVRRCAVPLGIRQTCHNTPTRKATMPSLTVSIVGDGMKELELSYFTSI